MKSSNGKIRNIFILSQSLGVLKAGKTTEFRNLEVSMTTKQDSRTSQSDTTEQLIASGYFYGLQLTHKCQCMLTCINTATAGHRGTDTGTLTGLRTDAQSLRFHGDPRQLSYSELSHFWTYSVLGDEDVSGYVEDEGVQLTGVEGQGVVIVEAVDLDVLQAHLVVGKDGVGVDRVVGHDRDHS